jgi:hypothetical protein
MRHLHTSPIASKGVKKIFIFSVNNRSHCMPILNPIDSKAILHEGLCDIQITLAESTPGS